MQNALWQWIIKPFKLIWAAIVEQRGKAGRLRFNLLK